MIGIVEIKGEGEERRQQGEKGITDQKQKTGSEQKDAETLGMWVMDSVRFRRQQEQGVKVCQALSKQQGMLLSITVWIEYCKIQIIS